MEKYKIVPAEREERSGEKIIKNRCKPSKKRLTTVFFGTPGENRTHNEPLGGVCYIHLTTEADRCNIQFEGISDLDGSIVRRRTLYPAEVQAQIYYDGYMITFYSTNEKH